MQAAHVRMPGRESHHEHAVLARLVQLANLLRLELRLLRHFLEIQRELGLVAHRQLDLAPGIVLHLQLSLSKPLTISRAASSGSAGNLVVGIEVQRDAAQRRHHVPDPRHLSLEDEEREPLHDAVHLEVERRRELDVRRRVAERHDGEGSRFSHVLSTESGR